MNSGDEMTSGSPNSHAPRGLGARLCDRGDGWIKDGDYNSTFGKNVLPLPYHARTNTRRTGQVGG